MYFLNNQFGCLVPSQWIGGKRTALPCSLLDSIDETLDPDLEAEWEREIETRLKALDNSDVKTIPWSEARRIIAGE